MLSSPNVIIIAKKMMAKKVEPTMFAMASGYVINSRLGPRKKTDVLNRESIKHLKLITSVLMGKKLDFDASPLSLATSSMFIFLCSAIYPRTVKITNPDKKLVKQFTRLVTMASLYKHKQTRGWNFRGLFATYQSTVDFDSIPPELLDTETNVNK